MTGSHVLFVAHEASRTGAVKVLVELLAWARPRLGRPMRVRTVRGGPLQDDLAAFDDAVNPTERPSLTLANSSAAIPTAVAMAQGGPLVVYLHEDGEALDALEADARAGLEAAVRILCASGAAAEWVKGELGSGKAAFVLPPAVPDTPVDPDEVSAIRAAWGWADEPVVVSCGETAWHKGPDLMQDIGCRIGTPGVRFAWIGRRPRTQARHLDHDAQLLCGPGVIRWVGEVPDARPFLAAADLLAMPSRRDAQPTTPLEAGLAGTPTVAFDVGGLGEMAHDGCIAAVPYPDTTAFARSIDALLQDPAGRDRLAHAAGERARMRHAPDVVGAAFLGHLQRELSEASTP